MNTDRLRFRVWDKEKKSYRLNLLLGSDGFLYGYEEWKGRDPEKYIIEQCTGIKDKNGKLIYEGDVLLAYDPWDDGEEKIKFSVKWEPEDALFFLRKVDSYWEATFERVKDIEIIGNIHEGYSK